jgi:tetratricopeptide (TPR) repeat protein
MPRRPERRRDTSKYLPRFLITAFSLGGMTLFIVLVILPRKYLLSQGLRESGISFPAQPTTFSPPEEFHQPAARLPRAPPPVVRGPGEIFWSDVLPLLRGGRFAQALPVFERYLRMYPEDRGVRREYAITLSRAGRAGEAVWVFQELLAEEDDREIRLFLARSLRDLGRYDEASTEYARLLEEDPENLFLALEWGRALSWAARYHEAAEVLEAALALDPEFLDVRIELARIYYWSGRLQDADRLLAGLDPRTLETRGAYSLWQELIAALEPPEPREGAPVYPPLTALRRAARATEAGDYVGAAAILQGALRSYPDDIGLWRAYADLLQYHLEDLDGARVALLRIEALGGATGVSTRFRLAQLELWTGKNDQARSRSTFSM